jgi:dihydropteroate synthase
MLENTLACGPHALEMGRRTLIMGIVNITPDSFSDGGHFCSPEKAIAHGLQLIDEGADILDIGGESTRPYSDPVGEAEEQERVLPVIENLAKRVSVPISIDTTKASVASAAVAAGATMINDISALRMDPQMAATAAQTQVPLILMHMKGTPKNMQVNPVYDDLFPEITAFLCQATQTAVSAGVKPDNIILDPGIGFGKTVAHNLEILKHIDRFLSLGKPILIGPSRKMFIRQLVKKAEKKDIDPLSAEAAWGTQAAVAAAAMQGAQIVRVHDVARTRATLAVIDAIRLT